jgi:hemerythrin
MQLELPELPVAFMNVDHAHAVEQWRDMRSALDEYPENPERLFAACEAFVAHNRAHFAREEEAMRASGFPPYPVHKEEHERVLDWLEQLLRQIAERAPKNDIVDEIEKAIPEWLVQHVLSMDTVTARWLADPGAFRR